MGEQLSFNRVILKSGLKYMAICPELNISIDADSAEGAAGALNAEMADFFKSAKRDRQLESLLEDAGYTHEGGGWVLPELLETGTDSVEI